jgi:heptosyltransferase-2
MGDVLLTTPLIRMLNKRFPGATIDYIVKAQFAPLIHSNPHIGRVWMFSPERGFSEIWRHIRRTRSAGYDAVVDLQSNIRSWLLRIFSGTRRKLRYRLGRGRRYLLVRFGIHRNESYSPIPLRYLETVSSWGIMDDGLGLEFVVEKDAKQSVLSHLAGAGMNDNVRFIVLAPGAMHWTKRWPAEHFAEVGDCFSRMQKRVVLVGGEMDREVCGRVERAMTSPVLNLAGRLSIQETAALLEASILLVTNDTGVMHMGAALGKPVVAVFGPTTHHLGFFPFRTSSIVVERPVHCRPCSFHGTERCPQNHFQCMKQIHSSDVIRAAKILLERN